MSFKKHENALVHDKATIGDETRIWAFANILEGAVIGSHCNICDGCYVEKGGVVGNHVTLKNHVAIWDGITLEDDVFVGAGTTFINDRHPRANRQDQWTLEKVLVKKGATIGANATIMAGVTIGTYAVIGAGAVVIDDVPNYSIVLGNPAKFIGFACRCGKRLSAQRVCSCGKRYNIVNQQLIPLS